VRDTEVARLEKLVQQAQRHRHRQASRNKTEAASIEELTNLKHEVEVSLSNTHHYNAKNN
jgi:hypothetical protein